MNDKLSVKEVYDYDFEKNEIESTLKKDIIDLQELCLELNKYVEEQDEKINEISNNNNEIDSIIDESDKNIDFCRENINNNRNKVIWSAGVGTILGLLYTGSLIVAPIAGITVGFIGYKFISD